MTRRARELLCTMGLVGLVAALAGCTPKPTEEQCERAVINIRKVTGQGPAEIGDSQRGAAVRSCRAQSSRDTVECYVEAQNEEELFRCGGELAEAVRAAQKKRLESGEAAPGGQPAGTGAGSDPPK